MSRTFELPLDQSLHADAYLQWASQSNFRFFDTGESAIVLLVEFREPLDLRSGQWSEQRGRFKDLQVNEWYDGYRYAAVSVSASDLESKLIALRDLGALCFELGAPAGIPAKPFDGITITSAAEGPKRVIGIIDDGCPFAHKDFRIRDALTPAVRFIWDQGMSPGGYGTPMPYGMALLQSDLQAIVQKATPAGGIVDEDSAYRLSGLPSLDCATSHGAQVMSHATGHAFDDTPVSTGDRVDVVFVQFPDSALDDPSGNWLDHYALDAVHAVRFYARKRFTSPASRVVINLSYGRQTGPHDGTSHFEKAIDELTRKAIDDHGYFLKVVMPVGNSHRQRTHAQFDLQQGGGAIDWCVSPDSQLPSYLEIWLPIGTPMAQLDVYLQSPAAEAIAPGEVSDDGTAWVLALPVCGDANRIVIVMVIAPTAHSLRLNDPTDTLAAAGRWKVNVSVKSGQVFQVQDPVAHAYLACKDPNMGRALRGRSGYLDSPGYDPDRYLEESSQLDESAPASGAEVVARGSLSGTATGQRAGVVGGYVVSTGLPSLYSSSGPGRNGAREGPDWAYPSDDTDVQLGRLAGGNRSATVMRLVGTSFAAPQYVRDLVPDALAPAAPMLAPLPAWFKHRFGAGRR